MLRALEFTQLSSHHQAALCSSFAAELESLGLWHWAVFALLHSDVSATQREMSVRELLGRHLVLDGGSEAKRREVFLVERLHVPAQWIHAAKVHCTFCDYGAATCAIIQDAKTPD